MGLGVIFCRHRKTRFALRQSQQECLLTGQGCHPRALAQLYLEVEELFCMNPQAVQLGSGDGCTESLRTLKSGKAIS